MPASLVSDLFCDLDSAHGGRLPRAARRRNFPHRMEMKMFHRLMQDAKFRARDRDNAMVVLQIEFGFGLVHFGIKQPGIRNKPAARGQLKGDALSYRHGIALVSSRFRGRFEIE
jgi:hypothetical protein